MKRLFPTSLAFLLVMASFGHVLAASFCSRALGHKCCFATSANHTHSPSSSHVNKAAADMHMEGMPMDGMNMNDMATGEALMDHNAMDDVVIDGSTADLSIQSRLGFAEEAVANTFDQPVDSCSHCLGHSGIDNAPISLVSVPDQSNKDHGSVPLPVSRFLTRPAMTLAQIGGPREHAPPGSSAPRHILINVFLI
jgi:hypothetical protein